MADFPVAVSNRVIARNAIGQFIAECELAGTQTMEDIAKTGAQLSRGFAPRGKKRDPRTPALHNSIFPSWTATSAEWKAVARHAVIVEKTGSVRHPQTADVSFFWEKEGRMWNPGKNLIDHPATTPQPYLRPAYEIMMASWSTYAQRHYPQ